MILLVSCNKNPIQTTPSNSDKVVNINIIEMNDIHGHVEQDASKRSGISNASYLIEQIRNEDKADNTILIGNGDMLQETAISRVSYGEVVISAMNQMKFDCMGIGNHEFDWGFDRFLQYFDGDETNGEANFPLLNANVYYKDQLLTIENKVTSSILLEKEDVKVGVISYIGDVYSSINANMTENYTFKAKPNQIADSVLTEGKALKDKGADIIIVNIHGGNADDIKEYDANNLIADLKYKENYLVDAVINGHTHTKQDGKIKRTGGADLPVVQSSGKLADFGRIDLTYNLNTKKVEKSQIRHIDVNSTAKYTMEVENIIQDYYQRSKDVLEEVYCENQVSFYRGDALYEYAANLMMTATNTTAAVCNTGAFRNRVDEGPFDFDALYSLNPFDNHIIICEISGLNLKKFYDANANFEFVYTKDYGASIATDQMYQLAIVDYVYFSNYFAGYRTDSYMDTELILRDLMADDLRLRKDKGFNIYKDNKNIEIGSYV
ncbi:MAG: metallophosphoesterase [Anaeroplasmataceae bacterium]|nr:metallophosphoesterase [Anaeroplasmataceae bacterium]